MRAASVSGHHVSPKEEGSNSVIIPQGYLTHGEGGQVNTQGATEATSGVMP